MIPDAPSVVIHSVQFQPGVLNIQYAEERETNDYVSVARSVVVDIEQVAEEMVELDELLRDIIDKALLILRNPPKKIRQRRRAEEDPEEESEEE